MEDKKPGLFRRILIYLGVAVVGVGAGAAAGEAIDQAFSRKRFSARRIAAAGGQAMMTAVAIILFVVFYPIYYAVSATWHWSIDDSAFSAPMDPYGSHKDIIYHRYFPNQGLGVIAVSDGCIFLFDLQKKRFLKVKAMERSLWDGKEYETVTQCVQALKSKLRSQEEYLDEVDKIRIWFSPDDQVINVQAAACHLCLTYSQRSKIFAKLKLADVGIGATPSTHVDAQPPQFKVLKLGGDGVVVAQSNQNGHTIKLDLHTSKTNDIVNSVLSASGRLLAVTVRRPVEDTFWNNLFKDCQMRVGGHTSGKVPCEYSTEVWDIVSQKLIRPIYWPPGIKSMAFTPGERYLATVAEPPALIFAEPKLKFWEIAPLSD